MWHAFNNISETTDMATSAKTDLRAVEVLGAALEGTGKPLVVTSGAHTGAPRDRGGCARPPSGGRPRVPTEVAVIAMAERGVRASLDDHRSAGGPSALSSWSRHSRRPRFPMKMW